MLRIAVVEDDVAQSNRMKKYLEDFLAEQERPYTIDVYDNAVDFLDKYKNPYDIVLMDIEMPRMNGLEAAKKLRAMDEMAVLIFVTKMSQFAINGYEVSAIGYILKPVNAYSLYVHMQKALNIISANTEKKIVLQMKQGIVSFSTRKLIYIEVSGHKLNYHLRDDTHEAYGKLTDEEEKLKDYHFSRCSNAFLVNLAYVQAIIGNTVYLSSGVELPVSRGMKKTFTDAYIRYIGR